MGKRPSFIPGRPAASQPPLEHYRPQQAVGAAGDYVRSLTAPGGLVVDLFCQGPRFAGEALEAGRRVLGFSINPLLLHIARLALTSVDRQALNAGFTRLVDSPRGDRPLRSHLASLYRTRCPVCRTSGMAEWFAWRRDVDRPFEKGVRCQTCGKVQVGPTDADDVALAESFAPRGLPYYYALDRAAPLVHHAPHPARERAAELVDCYTPRNLSALMDLSRRVEDAEAAGGVKVALKAMLLDCFDRCSKLYPHGEERPRPRTLRIPVRYVERNVWLCFEEGLSRLLQDRPSQSVPETKDVEALVQGTAEGYALIASAARDVEQVLPVKTVDLVLVDPPRPDGVFWALSALWAAWLWDSREAHAMRPFLRRRRFDWNWHWRVLREALGAVGPRLKEDGFLVMLFAASDHAMLQSICLAAAAGYRLRAWGYAPEIGYRLTWSWEGPGRLRSRAVDTLEKEMVATVEQTVTSTLRRRGEPTSEWLLHAAAHTQLADRDLLEPITALDQEVSPVGFIAEAVECGLDAAPIRELDEDVGQHHRLWWLLHAQDAADTLADRVELLIRQLLGERLVWRESDLVNAVYARFPGVLTPELELVRVCVASYGVREDQEVRLRPEDDFERRRLEVDTVREGLAALGQRLGYRIADGGARDMRWLEDEGEVYVFAISATAALASHLLDNSVSDPEAQCCLVVPGGRAKLIHFKLQRDPRLARVVDSGRWQFIKFRHLRRLVAKEDLDRYAFKIVLGLDPIVERERTQLPLF